MEGGRAFLQNPKPTPRFTYRGLPEAPNSIPVCYCQHHRICWIMWPRWQSNLHNSLTCYRAFSCAGPYPKLVAFQVTCWMGQNNTSKWRICCLQNPKRPPKVLCLSFGCRRGQMQQFILHFRRDILTCPTSLVSWNFTELESLWTIWLNQIQ